MNLVDEFIGAPLEGDDARQILAVRGAEVRRAFDSDIREPDQQPDKLFVVRRAEEPRNCTRCFPQETPSQRVEPRWAPYDTFMASAL